MLDHLKIVLQYLLPKQLLTQAAGWLASKELGFITTWTIKLFIKAYKINMQEAQQTDAEDYRTFNEFFIRPLKEDARPLVADENALAMPADGIISQMGDIVDDTLMQAKGHSYTLDALLACNTPLVDLFKRGNFATTYLSPKDYHRVHMPCDATLREMIYVPGALFSVNLVTADNIANLFARNERVICIFDTTFGPMAQILVGATIVGTIATVWHGVVTPPRKGILQRWTYPAEGEQAIHLKKGDEMGYFKLGSTVINLFSHNRIAFVEKLHNDPQAMMGDHFADII